MAVPTLRLHHRIVIPVIAVALVTSALVAVVSLAVIRRALEARAIGPLMNAAAAVSRSDFALNEAILRRVKDIAGADVITYGTGGAILATSVDRRTHQQLLADVVAGQDPAALPPDRTVLRERTCAGIPCYIAFRRVAGQPRVAVALVEERSELSAATQAVTRTIVLSCGLGLIVLVIVGQVVSRRVTGPLDRLIAFTRDVSSGLTRRRAPVGDDDIGRLAAAFNDMLDRVERAQEAVVRSEKLAVAGLIAARVAHDIRNPLSSIKMQAQLLRPRLTTDEGRAMLQSLLHDVDTVESVIRGLLEVARPGELKPQVQQLNAVVQQVLDHLAAQMAHRKIAVVPGLDPAIPPIPLDADRFRQALLNVINNAADAMSGGGTLTVTTRADRDRSTVVLEVCDDGVGIDPAVVDRLFDPFFSTKREGVGLGLVNTRAIVTSHGGHVTLSPREPRGTCVTMTLPATAVVHAVPASPIHG